MSIPNLLRFIHERDTTNWLLILSFDLCFLLLAAYVIVKQLVPALQGKIAFEIDETGITSYVKSVVIKWEEIKEIELRRGRTSSSLYITFKWDTDHGSHLRIALGFVEGDDSKIRDKVIVYFEESKMV